MLQRVFVAKKTALADTAQRLLREWREQLGLTSLTDVQVWHRYTVDGVSEELFARAMTTIFAEPPVDTWTEHLQIGPQVSMTSAPIRRSNVCVCWIRASTRA